MFLININTFVGLCLAANVVVEMVAGVKCKLTFHLNKFFSTKGMSKLVDKSI